MKQIHFNQTSLSNQTFSSQYDSVFTFEGRNHGPTLRILKTVPSCGCVRVQHPASVSGAFTITVLVDKKNLSGYSAVSAKIFFENGEEITIFISGIIK
jgi:hypothetical protein